MTQMQMKTAHEIIKVRNTDLELLDYVLLMTG